MIELEDVNAVLGGRSPTGIVKWVAAQFAGGIVMSSSFGAESAALLHIATRVVPDIPVIMVDTGFLFAQTHEFVDQLRKRFDLNLHIYRPLADPQQYLLDNNETDPEDRRDIAGCCAVNKNEPFQRAMRELSPRAWLRGIRRQQSATRAQRQIVEFSSRFGCYAISPLLNVWTRELHAYMREHDLPFHPLYEKGYASIGCKPLSCTRPITLGADPRSGRWAGSAKTECGLHLESATI